MQPGYRPYQQQQPPQRSPHAATTRRGIGPMVGPHPTATPAQALAQQQSQHQASERAKLRSRKPTDKNIPDGVEDCIIGDGVQRYRDLRELERRLDATMMRKRLDIQESVNRNVKRARTLRIWVSNTVEEQPWQADALDVDAFDFNTNMDSSYRVKIEGKLLDEEEEEDSDSEDDSETEGDAMDEDGKERRKKIKPQPKQYKFSHFFRSLTVDFDKSRGAGQDHTIEWKKPQVAPNAPNPPAAADFDLLEFKRGGDENMNITINLYRDEHPEKYHLKSPLCDILDVSSATRAEVVMGIWDYIKLNGLQEEDEKRSFECDDRLRQLFNGRDKGYIPYIPDAIAPFMDPLPPIKIPYTIRVDREFHSNPTPTIYDITVHLEDPIRDALNSYVTNPAYATSLREIAQMNDNLSLLVQKISMSKGKHAFFDELSKHPVEFIGKWLSSQKRDLEVIAGEATKGGGEDASGDEWRKGGSSGIWGSDNVRESVSLMVNTKAR